jgi:hypothetical protein
MSDLIAMLALDGVYQGGINMPLKYNINDPDLIRDAQILKRAYPTAVVSIVLAFSD